MDDSKFSSPLPGRKMLLLTEIGETSWCLEKKVIHSILDEG